MRIFCTEDHTPEIAGLENIILQDRVKSLEADIDCANTMRHAAEWRMEEILNCLTAEKKRTAELVMYYEAELKRPRRSKR